MWRFIKKYPLNNAVIFALIIFTDVFHVGLSFTGMWMLHLVLIGDFKGTILFSILEVGLYGLLNYSWYWRDRLIGKTIACMNNDMRKAINQKLIQKSFQEFQDKDIGEYISWYTNDIKEAENQGFQKFYEYVNAIVKLIASMIGLIVIRWEILVCTIVVFGVTIFLSDKFSERVEKSSGIVTAAMERFTDLVNEKLSGFTVLKSFGHLNRFERDMEQAGDALEGTRYEFLKTREKVNMKIALINVVGIGIVNLLICGMCAVRMIPVEVFAGGGNLTNQVANSLADVIKIRVFFAAAKPYFDKALPHNAADARENVPKLIEKKELLPIRKDITLKNFSFSYGNLPVLREIDMKFEIGGKYAIIGKSGSGKSTLLKLLTGQLAGYQGEMLLDGVEAGQYENHALYQQIAYIEQNIFLFNTTIRDNITLGDSFTDQEMEKALARSALLQDMSYFEKGLDTAVGENGKYLSGGQKQRIAIARALIHKRSILIVDEGTSALDQGNAEAIEDALLEDPDLTLILVTHHLREEKKQYYTDIYHIRGNGKNSGRAS